MSRLLDVSLAAIGALNAAGTAYSDQYASQKSSIEGQLEARKVAHAAEHTGELAKMAEIKADRLAEIALEKAGFMQQIADVLGAAGDASTVETVFGMATKIAEARGSWEALVANAYDAAEAAIDAYDAELGVLGEMDLS